MDSLETDPIYFALPLGMDLDQYKAMYSIENYRSEIDGSESHHIDFDCAVIVNPTPDQIEKLFKISGQDANESIEVNKKHSEMVTRMIESYGLRTLIATEQYLRIKGERGTWELNIRKDTFPNWKFILFKKTKEPMLLPNVLVTKDEVERYFEVD